MVHDKFPNLLFFFVLRVFKFSTPPITLHHGVLSVLTGLIKTLKAHTRVNAFDLCLGVSGRVRCLEFKKTLSTVCSIRYQVN